MKRTQITFLLFAIVLSSCQRVIDLDLGSEEMKTVIQGNIYNEIGIYSVKISGSVDFDQENEYPPITGALVTISDSRGVIDTLAGKRDGTYNTSKIQGVPGVTYTLKVELEDEVYASYSTMPNPVEIDSIYIDKSSVTGDNEVFIDFRDPEDVENYYRIVKFVNNKQVDEFYTISDELFDGDIISYSPISFGMNRDEIEIGDDITIWLEAIDKSVYDYFRTASGNASQSASPSNPESNITNGALGYFSACSVSKKTIRVISLD